MITFLSLSFSGWCQNGKPKKDNNPNKNKDTTSIVSTTSIMGNIESGIIPNITFPSPQAANYARYGDVPVDYSTGVPRIEIPLYTIKSGKLELPITISYHAGGIKVTDVASEVGLGWVLNAGGNITYLQLGQGDNYGITPPYKSKAEIDAAIQNAHTPAQIDEVKSNLYMISHGNYDLQADRYHYNIGNESGVIRRNFQTNQLTKIPYSPMIVNDQDLKLTSKEGIIYCFEPLINMRASGITNLVKMISGDLQDTISLTYRTFTNDVNVVMHLNHSLEWGPAYEWVGGGQGCSGQIMQLTSSIKNATSYNNTVTSSMVVDKITCRTTSIQFTYSSTDLDVKKKNMLTKIDIYSKATGKLIREILFDHTSFGTSVDNNLRLRLDAVHTKSPDLLTDEKYSFVYNTNVLPAYYSDPNGCCEDYWGFYNGCGNTSSIPRDFLPADLMSWGGDRNPNPSNMDACNIKEIYYPTGGKTVFEFEANRADEGQSVYSYSDYKILGGMRIKTINNYTDANSNPIVTRYEYSSALFRPITSDLFTYSQNYYYHNQIGGCSSESGVTERNCAISSAVCPMTFSGSSPVTYLDVKEYKGTTTSIAGKTEYSYEFSNLYDDYPDSYPIRFKDIFYSDRGTNQARLIFKKDFSWKNGVYEPVSLLSNHFDFFRTNQIQTGYSLNKSVNYIVTGDGSEYEYDFDPSYLNNFISNDTKAFEDIPLLTETSEISFVNGSPATEKSTLYSYDDYTQLREKTDFNSQNESIITTYKYPYDLAPLEPYKTMASQNFISPVVEQSEKKNTTFLQSVKTNYYNPSGNVFVPQSIQKTVGGSTYTMVTSSYDARGNLIQYTEINGQITTFLWGYNKTYPVAKIESSINPNISITVDDTQLKKTTVYADIVTDVGYLKGLLNSYITNKDYMVTLYTYSPLIGLTSQTDPSGKTVFYEYDDFGRLKLTKDLQGNIVKKYEYHYAGQ